MEAGIRNRFGLNIVAMEGTGYDDRYSANVPFRKEDVIVVIGKRSYK